VKILKEGNQLLDKKSIIVIKFSIGLEDEYIQSKYMSGTSHRLALYIFDIYLD
jgi:hypothetical protein